MGWVVLGPDPLNAHSLRSLGFLKSPPLKDPRSANLTHPPAFGAPAGVYLGPVEFRRYFWRQKTRLTGLYPVVLFV